MRDDAQIENDCNSDFSFVLFLMAISSDDIVIVSTFGGGLSVGASAGKRVLRLLSSPFGFERVINVPKFSHDSPIFMGAFKKMHCSYLFLKTPREVT